MASSWDRLHPRLTHRTCWLDHHGELPIIEGTLIPLQVDRLPRDRDPKPVWLWSSRTGATAADVDRWWQSFLRRFDLEHTFRLFKQTLGWTRPKLRTPRPPTAGPGWSSPATPSCASPGRWPTTSAAPGSAPPPRAASPPLGSAAGSGTSTRGPPIPVSAPKPGKPGPGRPPGSRNRHPAAHHHVGKIVKRDRTMTARQAQTG